MEILTASWVLPIAGEPLRDGRVATAGGRVAWVGTAGAAGEPEGRVRDLGLAVAFEQGLRSPPPETIFLHRKLLGTLLICSKLHARINVHALIERFLS